MARDALRDAARVQRAAARQGFDWPRGDPRLWAKLAEEISELKRARGRPRKAAEELGDLLFMVVNLARHLDVDAAAALSGATAKFARRYAHVERRARALPPPLRRELEWLDAFWDEAKRLERKKRRARVAPAR